MDPKMKMMAWRGILLPEATRAEIRKVGIFSRPPVRLVFQERTRTWALRGEESGGAVASIGHYTGFFHVDGTALPWTQRVQNFMPNGVHAVVVEPGLCRIEMFRFENTYDVLITKHTLSGPPGHRPRVDSEILFLRRSGTLPTELWGKDAAFRGGASPRFFTRSGEEELPPKIFIDALLKATEAVCCVGCRHSHLLELGGGVRQQQAVPS